MQARTLFRLLVAPVWWRLAKPRMRQAWAVWADDDWNLRSDAIREDIWRRQTAWADAHREELRAWSAASDAAKAEAERTGEPVLLPPMPSDPDARTLILDVDNPLTVGYVEPPEPEGLSAVQGQRRALADRLAGILAEMSPWDRRGAYVIGDLSLPARIGYAPAVREALTQAPQVAEASQPGAVKVTSGGGGTVIRLHGPTWSLVFRYGPTREPVLFVTDDMPDLARRVDTDPDWVPEVVAATDATVYELSRFSLGGDKYLYRPRSAGRRAASA